MPIDGFTAGGPGRDGKILLQRTNIRTQSSRASPRDDPRKSEKRRKTGLFSAFFQPDTSHRQNRSKKELF